MRTVCGQHCDDVTSGYQGQPAASSARAPRPHRAKPIRPYKTMNSNLESKFHVKLRPGRQNEEFCKLKNQFRRKNRANAPGFTTGHHLEPRRLPRVPLPPPLRWLQWLAVVPEMGRRPPARTGSRQYLKTLSAERWGLAYESTHGQTVVSWKPVGDDPLRAGQQPAHVPVLSHLGGTDHFVCGGRRNCPSWRPWCGRCCHACTVLVYPVLPIGADGLADKITAQGWALAPIASATRPQGAP